MAERTYEIRCPVYGFIPLDGWEREIINHPAFQRLRRIRQLAWTDYVYPGAMHTRFEHSLGVMHMATMLFDSIVDRDKERLRSELQFNDDGLRRSRRVIRLAALLHDVGHSPFSHAGDDLFPAHPSGERKWRHEEYSGAIIRGPLRALIEGDNENVNYEVTADEVAAFIDGTPKRRDLVWRELVSGQLDADRMDYLLRDSYHCGVDYGRYDWRRLRNTITIAGDPESGAPRIGIGDDGRQAAESLIIARYMMFTQVYFHKTRVILDHHLAGAFRAILPDGTFPSPDTIEDFTKWDDWRVLGELARGEGGEDGRCLADRNFYRLVWEGDEQMSDQATDEAARMENALIAGGISPVKRDARGSWYKLKNRDLLIRHPVSGRVRVLSQVSQLVRNMKDSNQIRLYVGLKDRENAKRLIRDAGGTPL
ncbi:MAG: HD domain-containing protein [Defluviicoccus sp.]|nr:HD domain-containing protein [Defluviicoccus sp.]MDG4608952.1 HD domain-containing protein [Defluviicoccus sp.]